MSATVTCPQCQAALRINQAVSANQLVSCPHCKLKFVPPAPTSAGGPGGSLLPWVLLAVVVGLGIGGVAWNNFANRDREDKAPDNKPAVVAQNSKSEPQQTIADNNSESAAKKSADVAPATKPSKSPIADSDKVADPPKPMPKKAPPKTYAQTKQALDGVPPAPPVENKASAAVEKKTPPAVDNKPSPAAGAKTPPPISEPPAAKADHPKQKQINEAIDKGVAFLKKSQLANGSWPSGMQVGPEEQFNFDVGYACLGGLTLLECQAPADDPAIQKAAHYARTTPIDDPLRRTYEMSTAILFLDRLGDPQDRALIQSYALQLVAGQRSGGGWNYDCPKLTKVEMQQLLAFLQATRLAPVELRDFSNPLKGVKPQLADPLKGAAATPGSVPPEAGAKQPASKAAPKKTGARAKPPVPPLQSLPRPIAMLPIVQQYYFNKVMPPAPGDGVLPTRLEDNSNTQFALLALWTARRHGIPVERALILAGHRYASSQNEDGGWSYMNSGGVIGVPSTATMTCVGLLGLAMAHGATPAKSLPPGKLPENPAIAKGLQKLGEHVDGASMGNFYLLWSIERVGVLYNLKTIGNRDWYEVGVDLLLPSQLAEGGWRAPNYPGSTATTDTCFALLFLRRSDLVQDLSERLPFLMSIPDRGRAPNR